MQLSRGRPRQSSSARENARPARRLRPVHLLRLHRTKNLESRSVGGIKLVQQNPPLVDKNLPEPNLPKSRLLVRGLAVLRSLVAYGPLPLPPTPRGLAALPSASPPGRRMHGLLGLLREDFDRPVEQRVPLSSARSLSRSPRARILQGGCMSGRSARAKGSSAKGLSSSRRERERERDKER